MIPIECRKRGENALWSGSNDAFSFLASHDVFERLMLERFVLLAPF